jgi:2-hydroxy-6-oxonona-2,4-dienedioate hydrolase
MTTIGTAVRFPQRVSHAITLGAPSPGANLFSPGGVSEGMKVLLHATNEPSPQSLKQLVQIMCYDQSMATDELAELRYQAAIANREHLKSFFSMFTDSAPKSPTSARRVCSSTGETIACCPTNTACGSSQRSLTPGSSF